MSKAEIGKGSRERKQEPESMDKAKQGKEPSQQNLPTVGEDEKHLQKAVLYYTEKRDYRMGATEDEVTAKTALLAVMEETGHKEGDTYVFTDGNARHTCTLTGTGLKPKVKSEEA